MERSKKNKENMGQNRLISDMFKVKKCLFDPSLRKESKASCSPSSLKCFLSSPVLESPGMDDSPFSLFKVRKRGSVSSSKSPSAADYAASGSFVTTPTNRKHVPKVEEKMDVSFVQQNSNEVKMALQKSIMNPNLSGDFSKPSLLPTIQGRHPDLKTVSPAIVASLVDGSSDAFSFTLIDCRYPYEYNAGHIQNARNVFMKEDIVKLLLDSSTTATREESKQVLVFYCEFSSERAPSMLRHLRNADRDLNQDHYPFVFYPELYVLEGGYKAFFTHFKELCDPQEYKRMLDKDCAEELAFYKSKCKSSNRSSRRLKRTRSALVF